jgi:hypothetical protein
MNTNDIKKLQQQIKKFQVIKQQVIEDMDITKHRLRNKTDLHIWIDRVPNIKINLQRILKVMNVMIS